jgi:type II secretory pathway pseudopilin PulG
VAIIAILAAIAAPNFLEAQTRAKVAGAEADMRSMTTAMETYHIDTNTISIPSFCRLSNSSGSSSCPPGRVTIVTFPVHSTGIQYIFGATIQFSLDKARLGKGYRRELVSIFSATVAGLGLRFKNFENCTFTDQFGTLLNSP